MASGDKESNPLLAELVQSNNKFARDIYRILANKNQNVIFSPISLQAVLWMALAGARGTTEEEMKIGLSLSKDKSKILQGVRLLLDSLECPNLKIASKIFVDQGYNVKPEYEKLLMEYFKSSFTAVDFVESRDKAAETINSWIAKETEGKITDIIPSPDALSDLTRLILVNGVHFKDEWESKFRPYFTGNEPFYSAKDRYANIRMMNARQHRRYLEKDSYEVLEIPYKKADFCLLILLPKEIDGLHQLEEKLEEIDLDDIFDHLEYRLVDLALPKFKMEQDIEMTDVLKKLGMNNMFDEKTADFSEIFCIEHKSEGLFVNGVMQSVLLEVDEDGTEAAAFTRISLCGGGPSPTDIVEFKVNHPFIFLILHQNTILFMGKKISP